MADRGKVGLVDVDSGFVDVPEDSCAEGALKRVVHVTGDKGHQEVENCLGNTRSTPRTVEACSGRLLGTVSRSTGEYHV